MTTSSAQDAPRERATATSGAWPTYLATLLGGALVALGLFYGGLLELQATGRLPPPAFTNNICIDEKLAFMREQPARAPTLLVIGSSVAWRHFDGSAVTEAGSGAEPFNGGFCGLHADQSVYVSNWLLDRYPSVRDVLMIAAPQDFEDCTTARTAVFNREDVDHYVFGSANKWSYYIRYFAPGSLIRNAIDIADQRTNGSSLGALVFDRFGDGPLDTTASRAHEVYGAVEGQDPACYAAVRGLASRLRSEGRRFMVATMPLNPHWKAKDDPDGRVVREFTDGARALVNDPNTNFWDGSARWTVGEAAFTDAIHIRWSAAREFSRALVRALDLTKA